MEFPPLTPQLVDGAVVPCTAQRRRIIDTRGNAVVYPQVNVVMRYRPIGEIVLPTGRIIASDPAMISDFLPFRQRVRPGKYAIELVMATFPDERRGERVALAVIRFSSGLAVTWENAAREDEDPATLGPDEAFAYGVDTGEGCFADVAALQAITDGQRGEEHGAWLSDDAGSAGCSRFFVADEASGANIALFRSGMGDGTYSSYFGYRADGEPCCLMTTFDVIELELPASGAARRWWKFW